MFFQNNTWRFFKKLFLAAMGVQVVLLVLPTINGIGVSLGKLIKIIEYPVIELSGYTSKTLIELLGIAPDFVGAFGYFILGTIYLAFCMYVTISICKFIKKKNNK
jgi:hypothetical protein